MPEGTGQSFDGISPPDRTMAGGPPSTSPMGGVPHFGKHDPRKLAKSVLIAGAAFLAFYTMFAFVLFALLPSPDWGKEGLRLFGNLFYISMSSFALAGVGVLAYHLFRRGGFSMRKLHLLFRPAIVLVYVVGVAAFVIVSINREPPLPPIDLLEPLDQQTLTAPVSITFGTESIRAVLKNRQLFPRQYRWDFNGDGIPDAEKSEHEITTIYRKKGSYLVHLLMTLSDGSVKSAYRRVVIPSAMFTVSTTTPIMNEPVEFDVVSLLTDPSKVDFIFWDFDGDGDADVTTQKHQVTHVFEEIGTYHVEVLIQEKSGVQESYVRPITVLSKPEQPFTLTIESDGPMRGSAPIGMMFHSAVEEGVEVREVRWRVEPPLSILDIGVKEYRGERMTHTFTSAGEYLITVEVTDVNGRSSGESQTVTILDPLVLKDVTIAGSPHPDAKGRLEGAAPLEVRLTPNTRTPFITFRWEQENASRVFSTDGNYHALYNEVGTYPLVLIAEDTDDRMQKLPYEIVVTPPKSRVLFSAMPSTGIAPLDVTFDASQSLVPGKRITGFAWLFGDEPARADPRLLGAQVSHRYESEGTYRVTVRALTEDGETFEAQKTIVVRSPTLDACIFPSRTTGEAPMGVRLDANCSTGYIENYSWNFGDGQSAENATPILDHIFEQAGTYTVELEITDGKGGVSDASVTITVEE